MAHVVWLKRDLRIDDHEALARAVGAGTCVVLYVYEPDYYATAEFDPSHHVFIDACLAELEAALAVRGGRLTYRAGAMPDVLEALRDEIEIESLHSHEETGNAITYARDLRVGAWCRARGIAWHEYAQTGVVRRLRSRDGWAKRWEARMLRPIVAAPERIASAELAHEARRSLADLGQPPSTKDEALPGGASSAQTLLATFLIDRGVDYRKAMSSPVTAFDACSRLSPYLTYGAISMKRVYQATVSRTTELRALRGEGVAVDARWLGAMSSFAGRLHWHCHFMQKLEDEPTLEFENQARAYDGLREGAFDVARFDAWRAGMTGYPMVDACMRALHRCGWINFRMRAMLMSFASYHLWLHWRPTAVYLGTQFLDFEAGIHYPQSQMQAGTTGINTLRIIHRRSKSSTTIRQARLSAATCPNSRACRPNSSRNRTRCRRSSQPRSAFAAASITRRRSSITNSRRRARKNSSTVSGAVRPRDRKRRRFTKNTAAASRRRRALRSVRSG